MKHPVNESEAVSYTHLDVYKRQEIMYQQTVVYQWERTRGKRNTTWGPDQFQRRIGQCIQGRWKCDILSYCSDGTDESPECVPLVYHPGQFRCTVTQRCIPSGWIGDGEPACGASNKQMIKNSDEDPHRYFLCNTTYGPETYWHIKQYYFLITDLD